MTDGIGKDCAKKEAQVELHMHPNFKAYGLEDIIQVMAENNLDMIALEYLNQPVFHEVQNYLPHLRNKGYIVETDSTVMRIKKEGNRFYILRAMELWTREDFHILTIGSDNTKPYQSIRKMIDSAVPDSLVIFDHPFIDNHKVYQAIGKTKERELNNICKEYHQNIALEWNGYCLDAFWQLKKILGGKHVNDEVIKLSSDLFKRGYDVPVVTDTDLHARSLHALKVVGTGRIRTELNLDSGRKIISSLKENIFSHRYENTYRTVSFAHFALYFAMPYFFPKWFERPRG